MCYRVIHLYKINCTYVTCPLNEKKFIPNISFEPTIRDGKYFLQYYYKRQFTKFGYDTN